MLCEALRFRSDNILQNYYDNRETAEGSFAMKEKSVISLEGVSCCDKALVEIDTIGFFTN